MKREFSFITGAHRSGTTWLGRVIGQAPRTFYSHEALANATRPGYFAVETPVSYPIIPLLGEERYAEAYTRLSEMQFNLSAGVKLALKRPKPFQSALRLPYYWLSLAAQRRRSEKIVAKDPFMMLSTGWLRANFGGRVAISVRHPASTISSWRKLGWPIPIEAMFKQPGFGENIYGDYADQLRELDPQDYTYAGSLFWRFLYETALEQSEGDENIRFIRYEDLCADPIPQFRELFEFFELEFTQDIQQYIKATSTGPAEFDYASNIHSVRRDSAEMASVFSSRMTPEELDQIAQNCAPIAQQFYPEQHWGLS